MKIFKTNISNLRQITCRQGTDVAEVEFCLEGSHISDLTFKASKREIFRHVLRDGARLGSGRLPAQCQAGKWAMPWMLSVVRQLVSDPEIKTLSCEGTDSRRTKIYVRLIEKAGLTIVTRSKNYIFATK